MTLRRRAEDEQARRHTGAEDGDADDGDDHGDDEDVSKEVSFTGL